MASLHALFSIDLLWKSSAGSRQVLAVQTQMWLSEYIVPADRKQSSWMFSQIFQLLFVSIDKSLEARQFSVMLRHNAIRTRPLCLCPTDWSFTHNNLHGNRSGCRGNCLLTVNPSAWCESGGCLGDNLRQEAGVSDLCQGQPSPLPLSSSLRHSVAYICSSHPLKVNNTLHYCPRAPKSCSVTGSTLPLYRFTHCMGTHCLSLISFFCNHPFQPEAHYMIGKANSCSDNKL